MSAVVIFVLMVLHTLTMLFTVEKEIPNITQKNFKRTIGELIKNKNVFRVMVVFVLYYISTYISTPFYGTYQISELGLNLKFVSVITMCGSISRIVVSKFWGRYADKKSFTLMIEKCFIFLALAQISVVLASPVTGKVLFVLYYLFHGIALGGINSALINLIFDYVPMEQRADSLAITQAIAGLVGFLSTLCVSSLISYIQKNEIIIGNIQVYAQQIVSIIAVTVTIVAIVYVKKSFRRTKNV